MSKRISFLLSLLIILFIIPSIALSATIQLPQTGQTKCYDTAGTEIPCAVTGQDGEIRAGVAWPSPRFVVNGDCVTDNLTGLMWAKNGNLPNSSKTWSEALAYIASINSGSGLCGYTDWRLPNVKELESLVNADVPNTATWLNTQGFSYVQSNYYWSSSTHAYYNNYAWIVDMNVGDVSNGSKDYNGNYVWPVRSGQ